jgi:hypothetical protein
MKRDARRRLEGWKALRLGSLQGLIWMGATAHLVACPICFQVEQGPVTDGVRAAVVVLVGVTIGVLSGFGVFVARFVARSNAVRPGSGTAETAEKRPVPLCR